MRIALLSPGHLSAFNKAVLNRVFDEEGVEVVGACIDCSHRRASARIIREFKKGRGGYVMVMILKSFLGRLGAQGETESSMDFFSSRGVPTLGTAELYSKKTVSWLNGLAPECILRIGFGIIREPILTLAPKGVLSFHHGDMRRYRGMPSAFWEVYNGEKEMGVTLQVLANGLDCGKIVKEIKVPVYKRDSWNSLQTRAFGASVEMVTEGLRLLMEDSFVPTPLRRDQLGKVYTAPNLKQWLALQARVFFRRLHLESKGTCN